MSYFITVGLTIEQAERFKALCKEKNLKYSDIMDAGFERITTTKETLNQSFEKDTAIYKLQAANKKLQEHVLEQADEIESLKKKYGV